jgi:hypothetical protein
VHSGARQRVPGLDVAGAGADDHRARSLFQLQDPNSEGDATSAGFEVTRERCGDGPKIGEAGSREVERRDADAVRLELAEPLRADALGRYAVRRRTTLELVEPPELIRARGDDDLPADLIRHGGGLAKAEEELPSARGEPCLQRARRVVDARVDDTAAPAGLVQRRSRLFVDNDDFPVGSSAGELPRGCQSDDTGPDDHCIRASR